MRRSQQWVDDLPAIEEQLRALSEDMPVGMTETDGQNEVRMTEISKLTHWRNLALDYQAELARLQEGYLKKLFYRYPLAVTSSVGSVIGASVSAVGAGLCGKGDGEGLSNSDLLTSEVTAASSVDTNSNNEPATRNPSEEVPPPAAVRASSVTGG